MRIPVAIKVLREATSPKANKEILDVRLLFLFSFFFSSTGSSLFFPRSLPLLLLLVVHLSSSHFASSLHSQIITDLWSQINYLCIYGLRNHAPKGFNYLPFPLNVDIKLFEFDVGLRYMDTLQVSLLDHSSPHEKKTLIT